jgi:hypothetical protein
MAVQLIRVNIKKAEPNQLGVPFHEMAPLQGCVGSVRAAGLRRAILCSVACRWSTAASGEREVTVTVRKTIGREEPFRARLGSPRFWAQQD